MLASLGHLGVAALATLEISLDQQNLLALPSVFFKVQQTVHKATFYSGPPSVFNSPSGRAQISTTAR
jgi:hypothetical protein